MFRYTLQKWWVFLLSGIFFFGLFHVIAFYWYQLVVYRYDRLYEEATSKGTLIEMPASFQIAHEFAKKRSIFTRPDILARESGILQSGIQSVIQQYRNDIYRLHDGIVQNISYLRILGDVSQEYIFPERADFLARADVFESRLQSGQYDSPQVLQELFDESDAEVKNAQHRFEQVQKKLVLQDILGFKHEMMLLESLYRVSPAQKTPFDIREFWKNFKIEFSRDTLSNTTAEELRTTLDAVRDTAIKYRADGHEMRRVAREKRQDLVTKELLKWKENTPPAPTYSNVFSLIDVSLKQQMMYVYEDGDLILSTPITSGRRDYETVRGTFRIYTKERNKVMKSPFPEEEYELWVDYWLGFYGAYGIHDACNSTDCWRTRFGVASYVYNGSHGCLNTPYNAVKFIYNWARIGTTVHVK